MLNVDVPRIVQGTGETEPTMMLNSWVFRARRERTGKPDIIGVRWMLQALRREKPPAGDKAGGRDSSVVADRKPRVSAFRSSEARGAGHTSKDRTWGPGSTFWSRQSH